MICGLKEMTDKPVAVITNGALLSDPQVREELCHADMVLPSLDAYNQDIAKKIDRPYGTIRFEEEFLGLKSSAACIRENYGWKSCWLMESMTMRNPLRSSKNY